MKNIIVNEEYQKEYVYTLSEKTATNFREDFKPELTPKEMLNLGIFGGNYFVEPTKEFPSSWFSKVTFSENKADKNLNYFKVNASQPLKVWEKNGWIYPEDPRGWFQWYCRYYMGRRIPDEDTRQIKRWKAIKRHIAQIAYNCRVGDEFCRSKQRQAVLHWAYDSRRI